MLTTGTTKGPVVKPEPHADPYVGISMMSLHTLPKGCASLVLCHTSCSLAGRTMHYSCSSSSPALISESATFLPSAAARSSDSDNGVNEKKKEKPKGYDWEELWWRRRFLVEKRESICRDRDIWKTPEWTWPDWAGSCGKRGEGEQERGHQPEGKNHLPAHT